MDELQRDVMFSGVSDVEMVEAMIMEMRRRKLLGCVYMLPVDGKWARFASSTPAGTMQGFTARQQLTIFAEVAAHAIDEKNKLLDDNTDVTFDPTEEQS
jgi:hypothetical protein